MSTTPTTPTDPLNELRSIMGEGSAVKIETQAKVEPAPAKPPSGDDSEPSSRAVTKPLTEAEFSDPGFVPNLETKTKEEPKAEIKPNVEEEKDETSEVPEAPEAPALDTSSELSADQQSLLAAIRGEVHEETPKTKRDYSVFPQEMIPQLKKMNNEQFGQWFRPYKELHDLKSASPVPSENAYLIEPEYQELSAQVNLAQAISQHWQDQYKLARAGKPWKRLISGKDGEVLVSPQEISSSAEAEAEILSNITFAQQQQSGVATRLSEFVGTHKARFQQGAQVIKQVEDKFFSMYAKPTPSSAAKLKAVASDLQKIGITPSNPAFNLLMKSATLNIELTEILKASGKKAAVAAKQSAAGPAASDLSGAGSGGPRPKTVTFADYQALMQ